MQASHHRGDRFVSYASSALAFAAEPSVGLYFNYDALAEWDLDTAVLRRQRLTSFTTPIQGGLISPNGQFVAIASSDSVWIFESSSGTSRVLRLHGSNIRITTSMALSNCGRWLAIALEDGIYLWDTVKHRQMAVCTGSAGRVFAVFEGGDELLCRFGPGEVQIWRASSGAVVRALATRAAEQVAVSADGKLAVSSDGRRLEVSSLLTGTVLLSPSRERSEIRAVAITADGSRAACATDHDLRVWDVGSGQLQLEMSLAPSPHQGHKLLSISADGKYVLYKSLNHFAYISVNEKRVIWNHSEVAGPAGPAAEAPKPRHRMSPARTAARGRGDARLPGRTAIALGTVFGIVGSALIALVLSRAIFHFSPGVRGIGAAIVFALFGGYVGVFFGFLTLGLLKVGDKDSEAPAVLITLSFMVVFGVLIYRGDPRLNSVLDRLRPELGSFIAITEATREVESASLSGRAVVIDANTGTFDHEVMARLGNLMARHPNEVGVVVTVDCSEVEVGQYTVGKAYQWQCYVKLSDRRTGAIGDSDSFQSEPPPSSKLGASDYHGTRPADEIVRYMKSVLAKSRGEN